MANILAIDDEANLRYTISRTLTKAGHRVFEAASLGEARSLLEERDYDLVLSDIMLVGESGLEYVRELRRDGFEGVIVVMTAFGTVESAVQAMRDGADDYLQKPLSLEELSIQVETWLERRRLAQRVHLYERLEHSRQLGEDLLGSSAAWTQTLTVADRLARVPLSTPTPGGNAADRKGGGAGGGGGGGGGSGGAAVEPLPCILLVGETGVGKGVLARWIHQRAVDLAHKQKHGHESPGHDAAVGCCCGGGTPFVHVNASAFPAGLIEGELFGVEKGAFTDAKDARPGLFEMADGGTIFLDEIAEMPLELQAKLLLVVETGVFRRVGGRKERRVRLRVIAASNQDLHQAVQQGKFRRDLLYRLNAFPLNIPPLRERDGDAELIAAGMLERLGRRYGRPGLRLSEAAREAIRRHEWPGNVRELVNAVQRATMLAADDLIGPVDLGLASADLPRVVITAGGGMGSGGSGSGKVLARAVPRGSGAHDAGGGGNGSAHPEGHAAWRGAHGGEPAHLGSSGEGVPGGPASAAAGAGGVGGELVFDFINGVHTAEEVEKTLMIQALRFTHGNVSRAAKLIGMQRSSFRYRIERYALVPYVLEASRR